MRRTHTRPWRKVLALSVLALLASPLHAAAQDTWQLWASGLPGGVYPRLAVAPDHSVYFGLLATSGAKGIVYRASQALAPSGSFAPLAPIPYVTIGNNIEALATTAASEPVVGIFHAANSSDPIVFVRDKTSGRWIAGALDQLPVLGVFAIARAPNGDLYFGAKWSWVYKSTDGGRSYAHIDDTAAVTASAPCYYPSLSGAQSDGAIYAINVDQRGWVYAGTEGAGLIYSSDSGTSWQPVDRFACLASDPSQKNPASPMEPLSRTGNLGAVGFTKDANPVWNGTQLFSYGWPSSIGFADLGAQTVSAASGFPQYFIDSGLQTSRIVTTANGTMFLNAGENTSLTPHAAGIYTSIDGIHWTPFTTGITSALDYSDGGLATDGARVFMATTDGKIWYFDTDDTIFADTFDGLTP